MKRIATTSIGQKAKGLEINGGQKSADVLDPGMPSPDPWHFPLFANGMVEGQSDTVCTDAARRPVAGGTGVSTTSIRNG